MAKVGYIIVCEDVFNNPDLIIKKPYNAITPYSVPGNFSFVIAFSINELKKNTKYKLKLEIIDPDESNLIKEELDFEFTPKDDDLFSSGQINLKFNNVLFNKAGDHIFKVTVDDESTNKIVIPVYPIGK